MTECSICLFFIKNQTNWKCYKCKHEWHANCIDLWFKKNKSCPMCRRSVMTEYDKHFYMIFILLFYYLRVFCD